MTFKIKFWKRNSGKDEKNEQSRMKDEECLTIVRIMLCEFLLFRVKNKV